jgi:hypothetical protein
MLLHTHWLAGDPAALFTRTLAQLVELMLLPPPLLLLLLLLQDYEITDANISCLHIGGNLVLSCFPDLPCTVFVDGKRQQGRGIARFYHCLQTKAQAHVAVPVQLAALAGVPVSRIFCLDACSGCLTIAVPSVPDQHLDLLLKYTSMKAAFTVDVLALQGTANIQSPCATSVTERTQHAAGQAASHPTWVQLQGSEVDCYSRKPAASTAPALACCCTGCCCS